MAKTPGRKGQKKGDKEKRLSEVRRIVAEEGLTIADVFPDEANAANFAANPCANESAGFLTCDGIDQVVVPFPAGGPWVVQVNNGVISFVNAAPAVEQAPSPRENGGDEPPSPNGGQPPHLY